MWPQNVAVVEAFLAVCTQWRTETIVNFRTGQASIVRTGLDYAGCRAGLAAAGVRVTPELWQGIRVMELEVLTAQAQRR